MSLQNHLTIILDRAEKLQARGTQLLTLHNVTHVALDNEILTPQQIEDLDSLFHDIIEADDDCVDHYDDMDDSMSAIEVVLGL